MSTTALPSDPRFALDVVFSPRSSRRSESRLNVVPAALTLARLCLVPVIVLSFMSVPALTIGAIALFVAADIFDGVLARKRQADGARRRALDSVVDRIGIDAGILGAYLAGVLPAFLLIALLARDAYCGVICARMVRRRGVAIKADWLYRGLNLCVAVGAMAAPFVPAALWTSGAGLLLLFAIAVAVDLTRSVRAVESAPPSLRDAVIPAGAVRRGDLGL